MKVRIFLIFFALLSFFFSSQKLIFAQGSYIISGFNSDIKIEKSGEVKIHETIYADFGNLQKHGIFRDIPYIYEDDQGNKIYTEILVDDVLQDGKKAEVKKTSDGPNIRLRIGDPDETISGVHKYSIFYTARGVLSSYDNFDELYWDITGNGWDAPIASATARITADEPSITGGDCYQGSYSSNEMCASEILSPREAKYHSTREQAAGEGMTVVASLKKGDFPIILIERPKTFFEKFTSWPSAATLVIALFAGIITIVYLWYKNGRDLWYRDISGMIAHDDTKAEVKPIGAHEPVIVEYTPPEKLPPAIIGVIIDERADTLDITATIIDLASKGFLTIDEIPKKWFFGKVDYLLKRTDKDSSRLFAYEKLLLDKLFTTKEIKTSDLKLTFYDDLALVKEKLYEEVISHKFFPHHPEKLRNKYLAGGFILLFAGIFVSVFSASSELILIADIGIAMVVVGLVIVIFSRFMSRRTAKGREVYRRVRGYRMFIDRAESYKQKFFEKKNVFTDVLPYAIVFGLTEKFAQAMKDMGVKQTNPSWYHGVNTFNVVNFSNNVNSFSSSMSSAISSKPSSSGSGGGGFSGGGFGGGGGGSW